MFFSTKRNFTVLINMPESNIMWKTIPHSIFPHNPNKNSFSTISVNVNYILQVDQAKRLKVILDISLSYSLYPIHQQKWLAL